MKHPLLLLKTASIALAMVAGEAASAGTIRYTFDHSSEGWASGNVASATANALGAAPWINGQISISDIADQTGVFAPTTVLGNQSAAYGGSISWQVADAFNDGVSYAALILYGSTMAASLDLGPPSTNLGNLTTYTVTLNPANFHVFTGGYHSSAATVTQGNFRAILANLKGIGFNTEYKTGPDDSRFDNAVFTGFSVGGAVPEPSTWMLLIVGFGLTGVATRRTRRSAAA